MIYNKKNNMSICSRLFKELQRALGLAPPSLGKAETEKAKVGYERIQQINNPELTQKRIRKIYKQNGYPSDWIEKRIRSIAIRDGLTNEEIEIICDNAICISCGINNRFKGKSLCSNCIIEFDTCGECNKRYDDCICDDDNPDDFNDNLDE